MKIIKKIKKPVDLIIINFNVDAIAAMHELIPNNYKKNNKLGNNN